MAQGQYNLKLTLDEAVTIRTALDKYLRSLKSVLEEEFRKHGTTETELSKAAGKAFGETERILRML